MDFFKCPLRSCLYGGTEFHQKGLHLCFEDVRNYYDFWTRWGWVINDFNFFTIPFSTTDSRWRYPLEQLRRHSLPILSKDLLLYWLYFKSVTFKLVFCQSKSVTEFCSEIQFHQCVPLAKSIDKLISGHCEFEPCACVCACVCVCLCALGVLPADNFNSSSLRNDIGHIFSLNHYHMQFNNNHVMRGTNLPQRQQILAYIRGII